MYRLLSNVSQTSLFRKALQNLIQSATTSTKDMNTWSLKSQIAITFNVRIFTDKKYNGDLKIFH